MIDVINLNHFLSMSENPNQNHDEENYLSDYDYYSEEESFSSASLEDLLNKKPVVHPIVQDKITTKTEMSTSEEIRENMFKIINEDYAEQADSSSNAYISDEKFDIPLKKHNHIPKSENDPKNQRSISSMRRHLEKRNEAIQERIKERKRKREAERKASERETSGESLLGKKKLEASLRDGSLSSAGSQFDSKYNDFDAKQRFKLERREARRIAREKRRQNRIERKGERLHEKYEKKSEKYENRIHRHSNHLDWNNNNNKNRAIMF